VAMRHVNDPAPRPSHLVPGLPPQIDLIILRALAKDPTRRWGSAGAVARALREWRHAGPPVPVTRAPQVQAAPPARGSLAPTIVVVILVIGALAALLWTGFRNLPEPVEPTPSSVLTPREPVITGGIAEETANSDEVVPQIVPAEQPLPDPPPTTDAGATVPTIAPVAAAGVVVPNLQGMTIGGSMGALLPLDLLLVQDQPVYSDTVPLNAVVAQDPPPGTRVAPGSMIRVSLSRGSSPFPASGQP
jgi:eukaryotic-like serine/threonine-protein kinase